MFWGLNIQSSCIDFAKAAYHLPNLEFLEADMVDFKCDSNEVAFDIIVLFNVLENLEDPEAFLLSLKHRFSSQNTQLIISSNNRNYARQTQAVKGTNNARWSVAEFRSILKAHFADVVLFSGQDTNPIQERIPIDDKSIVNPILGTCIINSDASLVQEEQPAVLVENGIKLHNQGQFDEALSYYSRALQIDNQFLDALHLTAHAYMMKGRLDVAEKWMTRAIEFGQYAPIVGIHAQ